MSGAPKTVRGTGLEPEDLQKGKVFVVSYVPKIRYAWDTGVAIGRYLEELKNGRLIARRCHRCQRTMIPPRMFCERCFRPTDEWVYVQDTGTVNTFSLCYVSWDVRPLKEPEIPAVIEIDAASPGMGILHLLGRVDPKAVRVGMRVRAVWRPEKERTGSITDIQFFEPLQDAATQGNSTSPRQGAVKTRQRQPPETPSPLPEKTPTHPPRVWTGEIPLESLYTAGLGGQIFLEALKERGELVGTRCAACAQVYVPARAFCERCFAELSERVTLKPEGTLASFTFSYFDRDARRLDTPQALATVRLEGATTVLLHRLLKVADPEQVQIGARVRAVIKPKGQRTGSILDLEGFELL